MELRLSPVQCGPGRFPARPPAYPVVDRREPDYRLWFLLNASPDIHAQIESFPALHPSSDPHGGRAVPLQAVLLTDAELDHTLGLLLLREGRGLELHATEAVRDTLCDGTSLLRTLEAYCPVKWRPVMPEADVLAGGWAVVPGLRRPHDEAGAVRLGHRERAGSWATA